MTRLTTIIKRISYIWLVLWLVAIPLIHVHPEADHAHGAQHHQHGGLFHSVFSQDLACEFHSHQSEHTLSADNLAVDVSSCQHAHQFTHDEIEFSLLSGSFNDPLTDYDLPLLFLTSLELSQLSVHPGESLLSPERPLPSRLLDSTHHIRPPPIYSA